jgi:DNA-binding SARP family transcriptional activator/TolB-like protein/Tfp pilus assembly protein PilF
MIELRTLGGADLRRRDGDAPLSAAVQPKRLALVAYLAVAEGTEFHRRDAIVARFWPELDTGHARGSLRQALHSLRRVLDAAVIVTRGEEEISVSRDLLWCDAVAFREHCGAGRFREALDLYRGDFLDGFFTSDAAPELDEWIEQTRTDLRRRAAVCAGALSDAARDRGDLATAITFSRRAADLDRDDERGVARLISMLDAAGDRVGALNEFEALAARLKSEYEAEPSPETKALIARVRGRDVPRGTPVTATPPANSPEPEKPPARASTAVIRRASRGRRIAYAGVAIGIAALSAGFALVEHEHEIAPITVAVVPFEISNGDTTRGYVADGFTDGLMGNLARLDRMRVVNRRTMAFYRNTAKSPEQIIRELHADVVIAGTIESVGETVHITSRVSFGDGRRKWTQTFSGTPADLLALQKDVARSVDAGVGRASAAPRDLAVLAEAGTRDRDAIDAYIRGRYYWNERREPSLLRSVSLFANALHADPTFALAYSAMGDAFAQLGYINALAPTDAFPKARAAAERALALDSSLAEPRATLAFVAMYYDYDWAAAERGFRSAIAANPSYATAHEWFGLYLAAMGRFDEARHEEAKAQELDPLSIAVTGTAGFVDYYAGNTVEATRKLRGALRVDPAYPLGHFYLGRVYQQTGNMDSALAEYRATGPLRTWGPTVVAEGNVLGMAGRPAESLVALARMDSISKTHYVTAYGFALVHAALNHPDSAFAWLDRGYEERTNWMVWLNRDPRWTPIRKDPRFAAMTARLRLPK